jgi:predicted Zn-dependent peptidase
MKTMAIGRRIMLLVSFILFVSRTQGQDLRSMENKVTTKVLDNGLTILIYERSIAPVFSYFMHVDVGSDREVPGTTGLAHMFEHMAFKGTDRIGTKNYEEEKTALREIERAYQALDKQRQKGLAADEKHLAELERDWKAAMVTAQQYVVENQFSEILQHAGGVGINAFTSNEETGYYYSLPSNQIELLAYLESERFLHPVLREFYKERNVVQEERRLRESKPMGRLLEQFLGISYLAHPYGRPILGWPSDLESFSMTDAQNFYTTFYVPTNMVLTLVGDVRPSEVLPIVEKYFGRLPARPKPEPLRTTEPQQNSERIGILYEKSQPIFLEGYHKPAARNQDNAVYEAMEDLLSNGRTSRLYRSLVRDKKIAASSGGFNGFPGDKYPNMFVFYSVATPGHTAEEISDAVHAEIERVKNEDISDSELLMIRAHTKADFLRKLTDNRGLAIQLGTSQSLYGDWRELLRRVDEISRVSKADIRRVANTTFLPSNRTIAMIHSTSSENSPSGTDIKK